MIRGYKKATTYKVSEYLTEQLNLTEDQKRRADWYSIINWGPLTFLEKKQTTVNPLMRLTILVYPIVWFILLMTLPVKFLITGSWGYSYNKLGWFDNWANRIGL